MASRASATPTAQRPATVANRFTLAQVIGRAVTARNTVTFWLAAPGTTRAPAPYQPGQFVTLALPGESGPNGARARQVIYRSYSLCGDGRADQPWEITVKRRAYGVGSGYLHDHLTPGMSLPVSAPGGAFTLPPRLSAETAGGVIFVAAGSGITPIYGMLRALAALPASRRPRVQLHYAYHSPQDAIYGDAINALDPQATWLRQWRYLSASAQRISAAQVVAAAGAQARTARWYLCGPTDLMRTVESAARQAGASPERIHTERFFSPAQRTAQAVDGAAAQIRIAETGATLRGRAGESLLETLERHGYEADFSCRAGSCGTCRLKLLHGRVQNPDGEALTPAERAAGFVESCVAQPLGDVTIALGDVAAPAGVHSVTRATPTASRAAGAHALASRGATRRKARWTLAVASVALFGAVWNLTDHKLPTTTTTSGSSGSSSSSNATNSSSSGSSGSSNSSSAGSPSSSSSSSSSSGSSGYSSQPSQSSSSNSSTGVS